MTINSKRRTWVLAAALAASPAFAQLGGNNNPQDLQARSDPNQGCDAPISVMSGPTIGETGATVAVTNNSTTTTLDMVVFSVIVEGQPWLYAKPVKLAPGRTAQVDAYFHQPVSSPVITLCANTPVGVVDEAEPVMTVVESPAETLP